MSDTPSLSAWFIGGDTLLIECCKIFQSSGHDVRGVLSDSPVVRDWATAEGLTCLATGDGGHLADDTFDWLFAVTHLAILPEAWLGYPGKGVINFHDGPLPRYAGLHTPAWALMNREDSYGISWHLVTPGVDEGDLLRQVTFEIAPDETSISINTRCFEAAMDSFAALVGEITDDRLAPQAQDLAARTYFGKYDRPDAACLIDWNDAADTIEALVRALDFGRYGNPLGFAKALAGDQAFAVRQVSLVDDEVSGAPGDVIKVAPAVLRIMTGDGALDITGVSSLTGIETTPGDMAAVLGITVGTTLAVPVKTDRAAITEANAALARSEAFWERRLLALEPLEVPLANPGVVGESQVARRVLALPSDRWGADAHRLAGALTAFLARLGQKNAFDIGVLADRESLPGTLRDMTAAWVPLHAAVDLAADFEVQAASSETALGRVERHRTYVLDCIGREPALAANPELAGKHMLPVGFATSTLDALPAGCHLALTTAGGEATFVYDASSIKAADADKLGDYFEAFLASIDEQPALPLAEQRLMSTDIERMVLETWNATDVDYDRSATVHGLFERQAEKTPYATAVVFQNDAVNYLNLNSRANQVAHYLRARGIGRDKPVGVCVSRSLDLMVAVLGVLKAGGAYVPMDPDFPADRLQYMMASSGASIVLTQEHLEHLVSGHGADIVRLDADWLAIAEEPADNPGADIGRPEDLAYVIYTSGSTGHPKGVMIEHRNVVNFFAGMDTRIEHAEGSAWLAVTSLSFDISVLELFWTIAHGMKLVIYKDADRGDADVPDEILKRPIDFSLFMWASDGSEGADKYRLMIEAARFGDTHGFSAMWTPERHFNNWGGPYPNPAVTGAALAAVTDNIHIRAGSCVLPLHHPIRVAEDWAVVDNLSHGRIGISVASGWNPNDFVIRPDGFENFKEVMFENIDVLRRLWKGEEMTFPGPIGDVTVSTQPRPIQDDIPIWVTSAGSEETFRRAGEVGANLLTHLLGQSVEQVAEKVRIYREARAAAGHDPAAGIVTVMLHTLVGPDTETVREMVREPLLDYLRGSVALVKDNVWSFPTFRRPGDTKSTPTDIDLDGLEPEDVEAIVEFSFQRYFNQSGLFGSPERCMNMVNRLKEVDVDEIGCLIEYGVDEDTVLSSLEMLDDVRRRANSHSVEDARAGELGFAAQVRSQGITHLQCTPSMARMLYTNDETRDALAEIKHVMVGGETFPLDLAQDLSGVVQGSITNMYGPTETTIWSSTQTVKAGDTSIPIGRAIANTRIYILDAGLRPVPPGIQGDLWIGGDGVARGYLNQPELTAERFIPNPFVPGARIYKTGDVARCSDDGVLEYLGRSDFQVKIRGYRIELGEIETRLLSHPGVADGVVVAREDTPGDRRLVAYVVGASDDVTDDHLREHLRHDLPEYMVPSAFVRLPRLPRTPNGKTDRNALPSPADIAVASEAGYVAPSSEIESSLVAIWQQTLALAQIGVDDNFFDIGGNSLLLVGVHREVKKLMGRAVALTDLYRFPTIRAFGGFLSGDAVVSDEGKKRAARRQSARDRRRGRR